MKQGRLLKQRLLKLKSNLFTLPNKLGAQRETLIYCCHSRDIYINREKKKRKKKRNELIYVTTLSPNQFQPVHRVFGPCWFVGNWDKKPMILCACSKPRSREQSMKLRPSSENVWKVCLFYSQNNKSLWLSNMADTLTRCAKVCGLFSLLANSHCMEGPITEFNCCLTLTLLFWTFFFRTLTFDMLQSILRKRQWWRQW